MSFNISSPVERKEISEIIKFVIQQNFNYHYDEETNISLKSDYKEIYKEEVGFLKNSRIFVFKNDDNEIQGSIRLVKWNYRDILPIQRVFKINPIEVIGNSPIRHTWHIGRFAVKKGNRSLFKKLMVKALEPVCKYKNSVVFAECDSKLLRVMNAMGIKTNQIGNSLNYLGSKTVPVVMYFDDIIDFYDKNKHLIFT
ncbi:hypothetical protein P8625_07005 [Tenacibaculum tangerinum]|uniref:GNAT family N-acetyltransferase n=1 Tax=Tenacibaculum tangerinum TaxID=3038772 RepID=A0ABY8L673_9FLAO|nr:hypothetical protein [Tenacibaculum tangerinum]WGH76885.1 hypothetical protein P8625_07005 [Tenacibaculum tangerinum]